MGRNWRERTRDKGRCVCCGRSTRGVVDGVVHLCETCRDRYLADMPDLNNRPLARAAPEVVSLWRRLYQREDPGFEVVFEAAVQGLIDRLCERL